MDARNNISSEELYYCLEKLIALHRNLINLLCEEYAHMGSLDMKGLSEVAHAKEIIMAEIWNHEQLRIKSAEKIISILGLDPQSASLLSIADALSSEEREKLRNTRTALMMLVTQTKELNSKNMAFAESSLSRIEEMKRNVLGLNNKASKENYSNSGVRQPLPEQGGRLLSTEA